MLYPLCFLVIDPQFGIHPLTIPTQHSPTSACWRRPQAWAFLRAPKKLAAASFQNWDTGYIIYMIIN